MKEEWLAVPGFEDYEVSNFGRVKSFRTKKIKLLKGSPNNSGYLTVSLRDDLAQSKPYSIHSLVLLAFVGPKPKGLQCNHIDGNKLNNYLDNLEYITPQENCSHAVKKGLYKNQTKLNNLDISEIRKSSDSAKKLAKKYNVSIGHIYAVKQGKRR